MKGGITVNVDVAEVVELMEGAGLEPRSYSGRAMYGKRCVALETDRGQSAVVPVVNLLQAAAEYWLDQASGDDERAAGWEKFYLVCQALKGAREDALGLGGVVYWPHLAWPDGRREEERE